MSNLGISAVLLPGLDADSEVLDLAVVLQGLVGDRFEILLVSHDASVAANLQPRRVPLRLVDGTSVADGCRAAAYELILVTAADGQFDIRELNHLLDAIETGADVAVGYRPHATDALVRAIQRCGWRVEMDFAFTLLRRSVWEHMHGVSTAEARRIGYHVTELPVSHRRPTIGAPVAA